MYTAYMLKTTHPLFACERLRFVLDEIPEQKKTHKEKSNKMQQCIKIFLLFHIYMKLNMFRATHRPSSGA